MPITYYYHSQDETIRISCTGELTIDEIFDYFTAIANDDTIGDGAVELVDLSEVIHFNVSYEEIPKMPDEYLSAHDIKKIKGTILFGTNQVTSGLADLIRAHFNKAMPNHIFKTVSTREDALAEAAKIHTLLA